VPGRIKTADQLVTALEDARPANGAQQTKESALRLALEAGAMGSWEWDIATGEIRWSENLEKIHGLAPGSFVGTFDAYQALIHPDDRDRVLGAIRRSLETGADYEAEFRSADADGGTRWMLGKGKVQKDERGQSCRMIGVCMDVTTRKQAEQAILEANRRKDEFLAMVSHELRNPLAAIMSASAVLDEVAGRDPASAKACGTIRRQTEQLARIVDDLLDVSRLAAGKLTLETAAHDLAAVVDRCVQDLVSRGRLDQHRRELRLLATPVVGDGPRLVQIVSNLLTNAIKYTPPGGLVAVEVRPDGGDAVLRVKDSGVGIAPELLPRIFDLFVQAERGMDRHDGGLGLGLSIVRRLVEAHGGRVEAHSPGPGRGAEFVVRLPLAAAAAEASDRARDRIATSARQRVLVIDDNSDVREALADLLEIAGHEVHQAADGANGLAAAERVRPDVAIVDIGLPGMDGFEVARRLKAGAAHLRLIALTGYGQAGHRRAGAAAGFDAYFAKPPDIDTLLRTLVVTER
jgi:two-component system CheB/CheR fusion protein